MASSKKAPKAARSSAQALVARGLQKRYRGLFSKGKLALRGVDLSVPRGSVFGLLGPNGAGKTTFVKVLLDVVRPSEGSVELLGGAPGDPRVRARLGYLPERLQLPAAWTPLQVLCSVARFKGMPRSERQLRAALERVGLGEVATQRIRTFSKGMRRRVGLAMTLYGEPELLVLDEPTDGLDPLWRREVRNIFLQERRRGATLFLNSHFLAEAERVCDRIGVLVQGRLVREGSLEELCGGGQRWSLRFAEGAPEAALQAAGFSSSASSPGQWIFSGGDPRALDRALGEALAAGALLRELSRVGMDLEQVLADSVGGRSS